MQATIGPRLAVSISVSVFALLFAAGCEIEEGDPNLNLGADTGDAGGDASSDDTGSDIVTLTIRYEDGDGDFFRTPWPSDHRRLPGGQVDLSDFPRANSSLIAKYRAVIEESVYGFATLPVGYFGLSHYVGTDSHPAPADSVLPSSPVQLIDVSPELCGTRVPVEMQVSFDENPYLDPNVLQVSPVPGFALRQGATYAFVVTTDFGQQSGFALERNATFAAEASGEAGGARADSLQPLLDCLADDELAVGDIAAATVFTTQEIIGEARAVRDAVMDVDYVDAPSIANWGLNEDYTEEGDYRSYQATFLTPIFQDGETPYTSEGGNIHFDESGVPIVQRYEDVPFIITVPDDGQSGPYPLLIWIDGTGWSPWGHVRDRPLQDALDYGFAVAAFMPQFHGNRSGPSAIETLSTYNFANPLAGRNNFRQQAADTSYFIRVMREALPDVADFELDTSTIVYGGQSQGAQNGCTLAAIEPEIDSFVLNGLAANLAITIVERKDIIDFEELVLGLLGIPGELDRFYPVLQMVQTGADTVETHNYARYWSGWDQHPTGSNVYVINGYNDATTYYTGINDVTIAADLAPIDHSNSWDVDPSGVWGREHEALPISGNRTAFDGGAITLGTYLDFDGNHYTIYNNRPSRLIGLGFWLSALEGTPVLEEWNR